MVPHNRSSRPVFTNVPGKPPQHGILDQLEKLPSEIRSVFQEMQQLDERVTSLLAQSTTAGKEFVARATEKGVKMEKVRRSCRNFIDLQNQTASAASAKVSLGKDARLQITAAIADLDAFLVDTKSQLRREGCLPLAEATLDLVVSDSSEDQKPSSPTHPEPSNAVPLRRSRRQRRKPLRRRSE